MKADVGPPEGGKLHFALANPMYGPPHPLHVRTLRRELIVAERRGFHVTGEISPMGTHLIAARNSVVKHVLRDPKRSYSGVLWVDSDIVFLENGSLSVFLEEVVKRDLHLAAGSYYVKGGDCRPTWGRFGELDSDGFYEIKWQDGPGTAGWEELKEGAAGFGCTWTSMDALEWLGPGDTTASNGFGPFSKLDHIAEPGDDYSFFRRLVDSGFPHNLWISHDLQLGHAGMEGITTRDDFVAAQLAQHKGAMEPVEKKEAI